MLAQPVELGARVVPELPVGCRLGAVREPVRAALGRGRPCRYPRSRHERRPAGPPGKRMHAGSGG